MMGKTLVIFYSKDGNTKKAAEKIAEATSADLYEIKIDRTYNSDDWKAADEAMAEMSSGNMPSILGTLPDLSVYDTVLIGGPVWRQSVSNAIRVYLEQSNLADKKVKVSAFWTFYDHDENYDSTMKELVKGGSYVKGLSLPRSVTGNTAIFDASVSAWLKTI